MTYILYIMTYVHVTYMLYIMQSEAHFSFCYTIPQTNVRIPNVLSCESLFSQQLLTYWQICNFPAVGPLRKQFTTKQVCLAFVMLIKPTQIPKDSPSIDLTRISP